MNELNMRWGRLRPQGEECMKKDLEKVAEDWRLTAKDSRN